MTILSKIYKASIGKVVEAVRSIVDDIVTSKEEREALNNKLTVLLEKELTQRALNDMSGGWLSRNIRPLSLIIILFFFIAMSLADGMNGMDIPDKYITLLATWGKWIMSFYFTSRGIEKIVKSLKN